MLSKLEDGINELKNGNYKEAITLLEPLALQGNADAQYNLGNMYDNGQGVVQDYFEAARLYKMAAAQGVAKAQSNLGNMYASGRGVTKDYVEAAKWRNLAAAQDLSKGVESGQVNQNTLSDGFASLLALFW